MKKPNLLLTTTGLVLGLVGTLTGMYFSASIASTPFLLGLVTAIWAAICSGVVAGRMNKLKKFH